MPARDTGHVYDPERKGVGEDHAEDAANPDAGLPLTEDHGQHGHAASNGAGNRRKSRAGGSRASSAAPASPEPATRPFGSADSAVGSFEDGEDGK